MLEGCAEDEHKRYAVPEGHGFAEDACQRCGCLRVSAVAELVQLRVDEGGHGELVSCHESHDGCGRDIVTNSHKALDAARCWMRRNCPARRKIGASKGVSRN